MITCIAQCAYAPRVQHLCDSVQLLLAETYFEIVQQKPAECDAVAKKMGFIPNSIPWGDKVRSVVQHAALTLEQRCLA